jgi:eukaryotic-like serine/threonine-protein kinase
MSQKPAPKKPAPSKKVEETAVDAEKTLDPQAPADPSSLGATEMFTKRPEGDADELAASFLFGAEEAPARPTPRPAGKPKPAPAPASAAAAKTTPNLDQTAAFAEQPAQPAAEPDEGGATAFLGPASPTSAPTAAKESQTRTPSAGAKGVTHQPGAAGPEGARGASKTSVLGDYRLLKKLGAGGMGTVYLAEQVSLERRVALKVLSKDLASKPAFVQRFQREARLMARLDHPNILRCHDVGTVAGNHYLAMEYIDGGSLQNWLDKLGKLPIADALHAMLACARALQHAHEQNMIHRDIKPDNLLLTSKGVVKLADLGLAKAQDDDLSLTKTGTGAGTPLYMAPEQARDVKHVDHRSDIYALGCMLYRCVTGEVPFAGETLVEVIDAKTKGKFMPARRLNPDVPPRLDLIIDKMVAADPKHRYQSCAEIIAELDGLGLAGAQLSFLAETAPTPAGAAPQPKTPTRKPEPAARGAGGTAEPDEPVPDGWYIILPMPGGKTMTQKATIEEIVDLIKKGDVTADTRVARTAKGARRAAASYPELNKLLQMLSAKAKIERKTHKHHELYAQIEDEGNRLRQAKRWKRLFARLRGGVGLILWLCVIAALLVGGYYLVRYLFG